MRRHFLNVAFSQIYDSLCDKKKFYINYVAKFYAWKEQFCWSLPKSLARYTDLKIILLGHQNNCVRRLNINNAATNFDVLAINLSVLYM